MCLSRRDSCRPHTLRRSCSRWPRGKTPPVRSDSLLWSLCVFISCVSACVCVCVWSALRAPFPPSAHFDPEPSSSAALAAYGPTTECVGLARLGVDGQQIVVATLEQMCCLDLGPPLHSLVIPGDLHPLEVRYSPENPACVRAGSY